jgi:hypothetical protein
MLHLDEQRRRFEKVAGWVDGDIVELGEVDSAGTPCRVTRT